MRNRWRVGLVASLAVGTLVAGPLADGAAWAKKSKIKCKINGETFKTNALGEGASGAYEQPLALLTLVGGRAKTKGRSVATAEIDTQIFHLNVTSVPDLTTATFPLTVPVSQAFFMHDHTKGLNLILSQTWSGEGVTMTITQFDGSRIKGTAEGTIPPYDGTDTPAVLEDCKFSVGF
jgi:hypothetical protein